MPSRSTFDPVIPFHGVEHAIDLREYRHIPMSVASEPGIEGLDGLRSEFLIDFYEWDWGRGEEVLSPRHILSTLVRITVTDSQREAGSVQLAGIQEEGNSTPYPNPARYDEGYPREAVGRGD
jgi:hypothetical protein